MNSRVFCCTVFAILSGVISASAQIQAGKSINISISGVPDTDRAAITNTYPVSENGMINMPYIGQVRAAGLRTEDLQASLQAHYKSAGIYTNPTIQVIDTAVRGKVSDEIVTVGGQVKGTGPIPYSKELTLWGAIQAAGGPTEFGSMKRVTLTRDGQSRSYDVTRPQFMQIPLQRNDTIEIPHKNLLGN